MRGSVITISLCLILVQSVFAHEVVFTGHKGNPLLSVQFNPGWTALASRDELELASADGRNRIYCMEFPSYVKLEQGLVFLQTLRDTLFQSYENVSDEVIEFEGLPARLIRGKGVARGFNTALEALIFRDSHGNICMVMLTQEVGYEFNLGPLRDMVKLP